MRNLFLPEPMSLGRVVLLDKDVPKFMEVLLNTGVVQVEDTYEIYPLDLDFKYDFKQELARIDLLESRMETICRILEIDITELKKGDFYQFIDEISVVPSDLSNKISSDLDRIEANITEIVSIIEKRKQFIFEQNQVSWFLSILLHAGFEYLYELNDELISYWLGSIPKNNLSVLKEALADIPVSMEWASASRDRIMIFLCSIPKYKERINSSLKAGNFLSVDISGLNQIVHINELIEEIEFAIWEAREDIAELLEVLRKKREVFRSLLSKLVKMLLLEKKLVRSMGMCRGTKFVATINIWVREKDRKSIESLLNEKLESVIGLEWIPADSAKIEKEKVPASFSFGGMWQVFFSLVRMYGYPSYAEINPILIFTVGFIIMYGMMFADMGHGLVLVLASLFIRRSYQTLSVMLFWNGLSATVWGIIFGSVFGKEDIISPLWVNPIKTPLKSMILAIGIGIGYLSLGMVLSVMNRWLNGEKKSAIFGEWGITSLLFYILLVLGLVSPYPGWVKLSLIGFGFCFLVWGLTKVVHEKEELIAVPMEIVLSLFSNTISFVRLSAFAINHSALMIMVFVIADLVKSMHLEGLILVFGNLFVIVLEAFLVAIQTLRLQFYEFFSKFYRGNGREFIPLRWDVI